MESLNDFDAPATPGRVRRLALRVDLGAAAYRRALELAGLPPGRDVWVRGIDRFLLAFGVMAVLAGAAAFFAYNWGGLHRLAKLGLVEAGVVVCVAFAVWRGIDDALGRAALFAAAFLIGVLFAVYGQAYQTGADPYGLFLVWGLLIAPWAIVGRQAGLWLLLLALANLSLILYWVQVLMPSAAVELGGVFGPLFGVAGAVTDGRLATLVFLLDASALAVWEWQAARGRAWMRGRWFPRIVALGALGVVVPGSLLYIFAGGLAGEAGPGGGWLLVSGPVCFAAFAAASLWHYRQRVLDLSILTATLLGGILVVTALVARISGGFGADIALLLALLLIGQTGAAAVWLRKLSQRGRAG